ncbi:hypothetical protein ACFOEY_10020 [Paracandidimonas soli]
MNLGVVQTLLGEVFSTDNCTVTENANGTSLGTLGLQICFHAFYILTTET